MVIGHKPEYTTLIVSSTSLPNITRLDMPYIIMSLLTANPSLTLSAPWEAKSWSLADGIDQDQTAQNMQSDLDLCRPLLKSDICGTIICGALWILFTFVESCWF